MARAVPRGRGLGRVGATAATTIANPMFAAPPFDPQHGQAFVDLPYDKAVVDAAVIAPAFDDAAKVRLDAIRALGTKVGRYSGLSLYEFSRLSACVDAHGAIDHSKFEFIFGGDNAQNDAFNLCDKLNRLTRPDGAKVFVANVLDGGIDLAVLRDVATGAYKVTFRLCEEGLACNPDYPGRRVIINSNAVADQEITDFCKTIETSRASTQYDLDHRAAEIRREDESTKTGLAWLVNATTIGLPVYPYVLRGVGKLCEIVGANRTAIVCNDLAADLFKRGNWFAKGLGKEKAAICEEAVRTTSGLRLIENEQEVWTWGTRDPNNHAAGRRWGLGDLFSSIGKGCARVPGLAVDGASLVVAGAANAASLPANALGDGLLAPAQWAAKTIGKVKEKHGWFAAIAAAIPLIPVALVFGIPGYAARAFGVVTRGVGKSALGSFRDANQHLDVKAVGLSRDSRPVDAARKLVQEAGVPDSELNTLQTGTVFIADNLGCNLDGKKLSFVNGHLLTTSEVKRVIPEMLKCRKGATFREDVTLAGKIDRECQELFTVSHKGRRWEILVTPNTQDFIIRAAGETISSPGEIPDALRDPSGALDRGFTVAMFAAYDKFATEQHAKHGFSFGDLQQRLVRDTNHECYDNLKALCATAGYNPEKHSNSFRVNDSSGYREIIFEHSGEIRLAEMRGGVLEVRKVYPVEKHVHTANDRRATGSHVDRKLLDFLADVNALSKVVTPAPATAITPRRERGPVRLGAVFDATRDRTH